MRKIFLFFAIICAFSAVAQEQVTWLSKVHDFGAFDEDTKQKTAYFRFINTTSEPVTIVSATATCGCTVPKYDDGAVAPGDTATIVVSYDPSGRPGRFDRQVYVRTSDSPERTRLVIRGTVIGNPETINGRYPSALGPLRLRAGAAMFGRAASGHDKMHYIDGYNMSGDTLSPAIVSGPEWLQMVSTPEHVAPGDMMSLDFTFVGERCNQWGVVTDSVMIAPVTGGVAYALPVIVIVEEDFSMLTPKQRQEAPVASLAADRIILPTVPEGCVKAVHASMTLNNKGESPLLVHRIYSENQGLSVAISSMEIAPGSSAKINVDFDPKMQPTGVINARVTLITNDPANPTQILRVVGERD